MRRGLMIIPGGLVVILLSFGAGFASDAPCPTSQTSRPRLFLQTDNLKTITQTGVSSDADWQKTYQLDTSLIDSVVSSSNPKADITAVELAAEKDLAALRIKTEGTITPYVGAGITATPEPEETPGISEFEAELESERQSYLLGAGLACDLSNAARLNLGYRYSAGNLPEFTDSTPEAERDDHHISFGLKLDF